MAKGNDSYRSEIASLYRRPEGVNLGQCAYCNAARQCLDHVPPLRLACDMDLDIFRKEGGELLLYPACNDCNQQLGSKWLATYGERLAFLYVRYGELIRPGASWTEEEINELGRGLRAFIRARARRRAEWIEKLRGVEDRLLTLEKQGQMTLLRVATK